jgi:superfamily I DNA/RNA helicase
MYEQAKRLDGRMDFTDLLCRFVGVRHLPDVGPEFVSPDGMVPNEVVGWIFDEAQDASKLLDLACRRIVTGEKCKWAWLVGDPYQVLYGWAGASASYFMGWGAAKRKVMPKSYRCAAPILALAERCLQRLGDGYWDRGIAPADHDGAVMESENFEDDLADIDPREETLVIARTNRQVRRMAAILNEVGVPYRWVKAKQGALNKDVGMTGLWKLQHGEGCSREEWTCAIDLLPSKTSDGQTWLVRGSKAQWERGLADKFDQLYPEELATVGVTPALREAIADGKWAGLCDGGSRWYAAAKRYGVEVVSEPKVRIGTIHSVKGQEADKVIILTSQGGRTAQAELDDHERFAEERRVEYVAVTRARRKVIVAHDPREKYRMELPL